jgi:site-specific DNA recombinase
MWSASTVKALLGNPHYAGDTVWNRMTYAKFHRVARGAAQPRSKSEQGKVARNPRAEWIVAKDTHEALVPREVFDRAQRLTAARGGLTADELLASKRNSPFVLSGLVVCARCGARWQGRTVHKGRRRKDRTPVKTLTYVCGSYVRKGATACSCRSVPKEEFEDDVAKVAAAHLRAFVATDGRDLVAALTAERAEPAGVEPVERLEERLQLTEKRIGELVDCLTPALAPVIEEKLAALRRDADLLKGRIEERRAKALDAAAATGLVRELVEAVGGIEGLLESASPIERREVLRGLVREVKVDVEQGEATVALYALPRVDALRAGGRGEGPAKNDKTTVGSPRSSHYLMAGAGFEPATSGL